MRKAKQCMWVTVVVMTLVVWLFLLDVTREFNAEDRMLSSSKYASVITGDKLEASYNEILHVRKEVAMLKVQTCTPMKKFAFVKTHKTGSTTVWGVLTQYTKKHKLYLPAKALSAFIGGYPAHIQPEFLLHHTLQGSVQMNLKKMQFVLLDHFRLNATLLKEVMHSDTKFMSVIRKPWNQFQSSFYYYYGNRQARLPRIWYTNCFLYPYVHIAQGQTIRFLDYVDLFYDNINASIPWFFRSKNYQAFDLGLDPTLEDTEEIERQLEILSNDIDLMMITEYMDESMILLKDMLCMDWEDILFFDDGSHHIYTVGEVDRNSRAIRKFEQIYKLDIALYEHFNATFWKKVKDYGRAKMFEDVEKLRMLRANVIRKENEKYYHRKNRNGFSKCATANLSFLQKTYDRSRMNTILSKKIVIENPRLTNKQVNKLSSLMVANHGGCPI